MGIEKSAMEYLKVDQLRNGYLYRIRARNAQIGIWHPPVGGFVISRFKFGFNYLFVEIHWDLDKWHGTVQPIKILEKAPFNPAIYNYLWNLADPMNSQIIDYLNDAATRYEADIRRNYGRYIKEAD